MTAFRTISEVSEMLETPAHVLRFWESRFPQVRPVKRAGGRRYYRPADVALLAGIRKLLHDDGLAIRGVQKMLRDHGVKSVAAPAEPVAKIPDAEELLDAAAPNEAASGTDDLGGLADLAPSPEEQGAFAKADKALQADPATVATPSPDHLAAEAEAPASIQPSGAAPKAPDAEDALEPPLTEAEPREEPAPAPDTSPDDPPRPRVLVRRRAAGDPPGLFSLMDAPEHPRPAPPAAHPVPEPEPPPEDEGRPLAALLRAADPARLAPHAKALAALHARLEAIRARRDCAGRGR
ncbi:MerR family transcriptional regulator [Frigidibacter albus]|uniref:MerR family transcriptional regulator n=1 Tax=Frigidibacter albus TaxID=1465486 RepID=UPI001E3FB5EA|nr:MerR family transcriptional regulator [Frigidibacter albus]